MTDNEIIKALECCSDYFDCDNCECKEYCPKNFEELFALALDLINRQKAEIESRNDLIHRQSDVISEQKEKLESIYSEAIKEFAERLSEKAPHITEERFLILQNEIDNLVKEMVGEG